MKIGVLTFQNTNNFGAYLQMYSTVKKLGSYGHEVEIVNYTNKEIYKKEISVLEKNYKANGPKDYLRHKLLIHIQLNKHDNLMNFANKNMSYSCELDCISIEGYSKKYDVILIGSDQVWNLDITGNDLTYFGEHLNPRAKTIPFAVSAGRPFTVDQFKMVKPFVEKFDTIYVREETLRSQLMKFGISNVDVIPDPTIFITSEEWTDIANRDSFGYKEYILLYFYNSKVLEYAKEFAKRNKLKLLVISYGWKKPGYVTVRPQTIAQFLNLIKNARILITSSYHATLFSIYFNTDFIVCNDRNPERIKSLLNQYCMNDRNLDFGKYKFNAIDWEYSNTVVASERNRANNILKGIVWGEEK